MGLNQQPEKEKLRADTLRARPSPRLANAVRIYGSVGADHPVKIVINLHILPGAGRDPFRPRYPANCLIIRNQLPQVCIAQFRTE